MEPKTYLECYQKWMKSRKLPKSGLCDSLPLHLYENDAFYTIKPTSDDKCSLHIEDKSVMYWGSDSGYWKPRKFTTLRQTLLLFAAALNDEL